MDRIWMYKSQRTDSYFLGELNKFNKVVGNQAKTEKTQGIPCPCKTCKNIRVFSYTTTIGSYVSVGGFVENYMIWTYHGEKAPPPTENPLDEIIEDIEIDILFAAYDNFDEGGSCNTPPPTSYT